MRVLLLLPLSRFFVRYWVASGRPFSALDRLVLRAIRDRSQPTLEDLHAIFRLPRRLMVEVLVTLFEEGWIAFDEHSRFSTTRLGEEASQTTGIPKAVQIVKRSTTIWMEGSSGNLFSGRLAYASLGDLKRDKLWDVGYEVKAPYGSNSLDRGLVHRLLSVPKKSWLHRVMDPELRSLNGVWLPVGVDLERKTVSGLPDRWRRRLAPDLLEIAQSVPLEYRDTPINQSYFDEEAAHRPSVDLAGYTGVLTQQDILISVRQHEDALGRILQFAGSGDSILIASGTLDFDVLRQEMQELLISALQRGVDIDLLWGGLAGTTGNRDSKEIQSEVRREVRSLWKHQIDGPGRLRLNPAPSRSNARMVIWVRRSEPEDCEAIVGSFDWLARSSYQMGRTHASVRVRDAGLVAELCQHAAALLATGAGNELSGCTDRWRTVAGGLESLHFQRTVLRATSPEASELRMQVVRDHQHPAAFADLSGSGQAFLLAPTVPTDTQQIAVVLKPPGAKIFCGDPVPEGVDRAFWHEERGLCACGVLTTDSAIITSYNPLDLPSTERANIGILMRGSEIGARLFHAVTTRAESHTETTSGSGTYT